MKREKSKKRLCKKCVCGNYPEIITGKHHAKQFKVFSVERKNPRCKTKPATANYDKKRATVSAWNNDVVTNHLMSV